MNSIFVFNRLKIAKFFILKRSKNVGLAAITAPVTPTLSTPLSRAYFKESLQLRRMGKIFDPQTFKNFLWKNIFHFLKIFDDFFSRYYNCTTQLFASFILKISRFSPFPNFPFHAFHHTPIHHSTLFHCSSSSSKFTTTTAQFPSYNCKLNFTTAQIVISCTLKYALPLTV